MNFLIVINFLEIGEVIEFDLNRSNFNDDIVKVNEWLISLENEILQDDYISITIYNSKNSVFKHENKRLNFRLNSAIEILNNPDLYPNYLDESTIPWWKNEK